MKLQLLDLRSNEIRQMSLNNCKNFLQDCVVLTWKDKGKNSGDTNNGVVKVSQKLILKSEKGGLKYNPLLVYEGSDLQKQIVETV